jgi:hypothetical protein
MTNDHLRGRTSIIKIIPYSTTISNVDNMNSRAEQGENELRFAEGVEIIDLSEGYPINFQDDRATNWRKHAREWIDEMNKAKPFE